MSSTQIYLSRRPVQSALPVSRVSPGLWCRYLPSQVMIRVIAAVIQRRFDCVSDRGSYVCRTLTRLLPKLNVVPEKGGPILNFSLRLRSYLSVF